MLYKPQIKDAKYAYVVTGSDSDKAKVWFAGCFTSKAQPRGRVSIVRRPEGGGTFDSYFLTREDALYHAKRRVLQHRDVGRMNVYLLDCPYLMEDATGNDAADEAAAREHLRARFWADAFTLVGGSSFDPRGDDPVALFRVFAGPHSRKRLIRWCTRAEAQMHCHDPESCSKTAVFDDSLATLFHSGPFSDHWSSTYP